MESATPTPGPTADPTVVATIPAAPPTVPAEVVQFHADVLGRMDSFVGLAVVVAVVLIVFLGIITVRAIR